MSKRTVLYLALGSIVLIILGVIFAVVAAGGTITSADGALSASATTGVFGILALACYGIGVILALVAWIGGLIKTAQIGAWVWFVIVLILGSLGALIWAIAGPEARTAPAA